MKTLMENFQRYTQSVLKEEIEVPEQEAQPEAAGQEEQESAAPQGYKFTNQSNFKDFNDDLIDELFAQIKTKDLSVPIFQAMSFEDEEGKIHNPDPAAVAKWLAKTGEDNVRQRIKVVGAKIPSAGLPKSEMPFLPGPSDAQGKPSDVEDALQPGGKYNIDIVEKTDPPPPNTFLSLDDPAAQEYMTKGHKDGEPKDDYIGVELGGNFPAVKGIPTQTNILLPKALGMAVRGVAGGAIGAYASTKFEILDGHHRWAATMLNKPTADIGTFAMIDMAKAGMGPTLKHLTAIGNALGNKTKFK